MEIKSNEILDERVKAIFQEFLKDLVMINVPP